MHFHLGADLEDPARAGLAAEAASANPRPSFSRFGVAGNGRPEIADDAHRFERGEGHDWQSGVSTASPTR